MFSLFSLFFLFFLFFLFSSVCDPGSHHAAQHRCKRCGIQSRRHHRIRLSCILSAALHGCAVIPEGIFDSLHRAALCRCFLFGIVRNLLQFLGIDALFQSVVVVGNQLRLAVPKANALVELPVLLIGRELLKIIQIRSRIEQLLKALPLPAAITEMISENTKPHASQHQKERQAAPCQEGAKAPTVPSAARRLALSCCRYLPFILRIRIRISCIHLRRVRSCHKQLHHSRKVGQCHEGTDKEHHLGPQKEPRQHNGNRQQCLLHSSCLHRQEQECRCCPQNSNRNRILQVNVVVQQKAGCCQQQKGNRCRLFHGALSPFQNSACHQRKASILEQQQENTVPVHLAPESGSAACIYDPTCDFVKPLPQAIQPAKEHGQRIIALDVADGRFSRIAAG